MLNLQEYWYDMDKDYSRAASRVAIPQLIDEINVLRDPLQAEKRFRLLVSNQYLSSLLAGKTGAGSDEAPLDQRFELIILQIIKENGGSVS